MSEQAARKRVLLLIGLALMACAPGWGQQAAQQSKAGTAMSGNLPAPVERQLAESGRNVVSAPPAMAILSGTQCDTNGNIYVTYTAGSPGPGIANALVKAPVSKVSFDSERAVQFPASQLDGYADNYRESYYADPRGTLYTLVTAAQHLPEPGHPIVPDSLIVKYNDDGTIDSVVRLKPPAGVRFNPHKFAAFLDGSFLVTGRDLSDDHKTMRPFTAIFDRSGAFVTELTLPNDVRPGEPAPETTTTPPPQAPDAGKLATETRKGQEHPRSWFEQMYWSVFVGSLDGNVYLLRPSNPAQLYLITSAGTLVRELEVKFPEQGTRANSASLAGQNGLFLQLRLASGEGKMGRLDLGTGQITDIYQLPPDARGQPACATVHDEFLVLGTSKDNHLEVVKYVAR